MTHTEAADLILRASKSGMRNYTMPATRDAILAAVATVMDAARADAFRGAAACTSRFRLRTSPML